ncbi:Endoglucanase precursor [compost metagenome]
MVSKVEMSGSSVTLTLHSPVLVGETVTISYFSSSAGIKSNSGQLISTFTNVNVANQTSLFDGLSGDYESADGGGIGLRTSTASTSTDVSPAGLSATRYTISSEKFMGAYQTARNAGVMNPQIVFKVPSSERAAIVAVPIMALEMSYRQGTETEFVVQHGDVTYGLPLGAINYAEAAALFNGTSMTNHLLIEIDQGTSSLTTSLMSLLNSSNAQTISSPIHTKVSVINGSSEKEITEFNKYTSRTIKTSTTIDPGQAAAVWYDPQTGGLSYVPTEFSTSSGRTTATFKRKGNSSYVLIRGTSSFTDIGQHWAASTINTMARKLIVEGRTVTKFEPNKTITRGEFATYIAKGLGLSGNKSAAAKFKDVNTNTAMGAYIGAASSAGIVLGNTNGTFKPNDPITRQEMAVMMMRAAKTADVTITLPSSAQGYLSAYSDRGKISSYAQTDVAKAVYAGIMNGRTNTTMSPLTNATRAEGTVMIMRLLEYIKFISS